MHAVAFTPSQGVRAPSPGLGLPGDSVPPVSPTITCYPLHAVARVSPSSSLRPPHFPLAMPPPHRRPPSLPQAELFQHVPCTHPAAPPPNSPGRCAPARGAPHLRLPAPSGCLVPPRHGGRVAAPPGITPSPPPPPPRGHGRLHALRRLPNRRYERAAQPALWIARQHAHR